MRWLGCGHKACRTAGPWQTWRRRWAKASREHQQANLRVARRLRERENSTRRSLHEALDAVLRLLNRRRIPCMVMGGLALSVWGRVRVTQDVDLALALPEDEEPAFLKGLQRAHILPAAPRSLAGHRLLIFRYLKSSKGLPVQVDLFFARGEYQAQALEQAVEVKLGRRRVRVITPEDLILYKLLADRPIDRLDARAVAEEQRGRLDRRYLASQAKRLGVEKRLRTVLRTAP